MAVSGAKLWWKGGFQHAGAAMAAFLGPGVFVFGRVPLVHAPFILTISLLAGCAHAAAPSSSRKDAPSSSRKDAPSSSRKDAEEWTARVARQENGSWAVSYRFDRPYSALLFDSEGNFRATNWIAANPKTKIENLHGLDVLLLVQPSSEAHFTVQPPDKSVRGTEPFLRFSDGSEAIHLGQFPVLTVTSRAEAEALHGNLGKWQGKQPTIEVTLLAPQNMLTPDGKRATGQVRLPVRSGGGYVYVGDIEPVETQDVIAVVDSGLPSWLAERFQKDIADVYAGHRARWGASTKKAMVLLAFGGTEGKLENKGYASGSQLSMVIRGSAYASKNDDGLRDLLWFFAHEAAHQFQFRGELNREPGSDWITEGAANTMALAVLHDMGMMDKSLLERRYWKTHRQCVAELHDGPLQGKRGKSGYVCGDLIAQMTAASLPKHNLFSFWNAFREQAILADGNTLTSKRYFALLREHGADKAFVDSLERLIGTQLENPQGALADAMQASGLAPQFADDGGLSTMLFPAVIQRP